MAPIPSLSFSRFRVANSCCVVGIQCNFQRARWATIATAGFGHGPCLLGPCYLATPTGEPLLHVGVLGAGSVGLALGKMVI